MKLLRLTSNTNNGIVDVNFNEDIKIESDSQVSLMNTSFSINTKLFTVSTTNSKLIYNDSDTTFSESLLTEKTYSKADSGELLKDIQDKINTSLIDTPRNIGSQFRVNVENGKTVIHSKFCPANGFLFYDYTDGIRGKRTDNMNAIVSIDGSSGALEVSSGVSTDNDTEYITSFSAMGKANSSLRVRLNKLISTPLSTDENGFIIALSSVHPQNFSFTGNILDQRDKLHYIQVNDLSNATNIQSKVIDGTVVDSLLQCDKTTGTDDAKPFVNYFQIDISQGRVKGKFYNQSGVYELFSVPYDGSQNLYPLIIMRGGASKCELGAVQFFLNPFQNDFSRYVRTSVAIKNGLLGAKPIYPAHKTPTVKTLVFQASDIATVLGFDSNTLSNEATIVGEFKNTSNNVYDLSRQNPYFIIISKNLNVDSYDSETGGRLNILHCFGDNSENSNGSVFFEPSTPVFLDIHNTMAKTVRNLRFEIRNADLTRINNDGLISLCLLIK
jgi:hypothetical protein